MITDLKPYSEYKDSGLPWIGQVPAHWKTERAKWLFTKIIRPVRVEDEVVTCFRDGTVTLRKNKRLRGYTEALVEHGYKGIRKGDLVIHGMDAFAGAIGVSDSDGKGTPVYNVCLPNKGVNARYYAHLIRVMSQSQWIFALAKGIRERSTDFRFETFGNQRVTLPPPDEQAAIVRFLNWANGQLEKAIRAKHRQLALVREMITNETDVALRSQDTTEQKLSRVVQVMARPIDRRSGQNYTRIGLYNRGRGIFHKAPVLGSDLGDSAFFSVLDGDFVFSGQFAWEGAVALARTRDSGCIASHRYPILRGQEGVVLSSFLFAFFRSSYGAMLLDLHSRGAAGRNRPLNVARLMKEDVPIPAISTQERIAELLDREYAIARSIESMIAAVKEYRTRLVADVVTGKLDVREVAAKLPDEEMPEFSDNDPDEAFEEEPVEEEPIA
jgi:type I restriction enzyme S subunit